MKEDKISGSVPILSRHQKLLRYRRLGCLLLILGMIPLAIVLTDPVIDLDEMVFVKGKFEGYKKVSRRSACGKMVLTFGKEDGTLVNFWRSSLTKSELNELQQAKGEVYDLWGQPNTTSLVPECRKLPTLLQIHGKGFQITYHKEYGEKANRIFLSISTLLLTCSGLCLLLIIWTYRKK